MSKTANQKSPQLSEAQRGLERLRASQFRKAKRGLEKSRVSHPSHYTWLKDKCGIEVIDITRHLNFNLGNVLKYVLRSGRKHEEGMTGRDKRIEDLKKALFYLNDEIKRLENNGNKQ